MLKKTGIIISNFIATAKKKELFEILIVPLIITFIIWCFGNNIEDIEKFMGGINDSVITITSLLAAFGLASVTILVSSSSPNVECAKKTSTDRKDIGKKTVTYYKLLIIRSFFSLLVQLIVLLLSVLFKFILEINAYRFILYFESYLIFIAIFSQIFVVNSMYYFLGPNKSE